MSQRECVVEEDIVEEAEAAGYLVRKCVFAGRRGSPDRWFLRDGVWTLIEFKRKGKEPDGIQKREHDRLRGHGQKVYVVDTHDQARKILGLGAYA